MWTSIGRPKSACTTCKSQKTRCSGERPVCNRCSRLRRNCVYSNDRSTSRKSPFVSASIHTNRSPSSLPTVAPPKKKTRTNGVTATATTTSTIGNRPSTTISLYLTDYPREASYLGISESLIYTLVEVYFEKAYNASLLLHKGLFLESLRAGNANPHVVLSVCAWAANFYRDHNGEAYLKTHGFMIEWAKRAGKLVFQNAEDLHDDNIVTFSILGLFWYGQGSWRLCYLHKGNACGMLHIGGLGSAKLHTENSLESEIRRRRLWACYLMHCTMCENLSLFEPVADIPKLPLPWSEADFEAGVSRGPYVCLESGGNGGGVYAELIKALTLWASVFALVKSPESSISERMTGIYALDDDLSTWWRGLRSNWKLSPSTIPSIPANRLTNILLINLIYHQSLCALHASVVPLFSWSTGDNSWSSARQASAQVAFEHACSASELIHATLSTGISVLHTFIAYAAYSGCAIQIPFMWCLNPTVKERAIANVRANTKMIHTMAPYWKFAALLEIHVGCLYNIHKTHAPILEDEPKQVDIKKLTSFKINAAYARTSILGFVEILRSKGDGYADRGDESKDLGIQDNSFQSVSRSQQTNTSNDREESSISVSESGNGGDGLYNLLCTDSTSAPNSDELQNAILPASSSSASQQTAASAATASAPLYFSQYQQRQEEAPQHQGQSDRLYSFAANTEFTHSQHGLPIDEQESLDVCRPFFDPTMLDLFPNGEMPDLSHFETSLLSLDYFGLGNGDGDWNLAPNLLAEASES